MEIAGNLINQGFPFSVLAKCLQFLVAVRILNDEINYCICYMTNSESNSVEQKDSYDNQLHFYEERIKQTPNYNFVGIFADEAISGTTDKRPNFQRMIKYAEEGYIDIILTKSISRFSRNVADLLKYCELLRNHNVNVIFEENSIDLLSAQMEYKCEIPVEGSEKRIITTNG